MITCKILFFHRIFKNWLRKILNKIAKQRENLSEDVTKSKEKKKLLNRKLICFLKILSCFDSFKDTTEGNYLFSETLAFLRSNNEDVQKLALKMLPLFQNHNINTFQTLLKKLHSVIINSNSTYFLFLERNISCWTIEFECIFAKSEFFNQWSKKSHFLIK